MKASEKPLKFLIMEGKVKIPFFQRAYVWNLENWQMILDELLRETNGTNNFLGAIILKQVPSSSGEAKQLEVIDGQQRLTTLSILIKALYDVLPDNIKRNCENDIMGILRYKKDYTSESYELRIEHSYIDSKYYKDVIEGNVNIEGINEDSHLILQCYKFFVEKLKELEPNKLSELVNRLLNPENKMLVVIDLDEKDDEQVIFDALNTAGVRLTIADIVKNAIFKKAVELSSKEEAIKLYKDKWEKTFLRDEEISEFWKAERKTGRLKRNNIEILLHSIGVIEGFYDPDKHSIPELSSLYKSKLKEVKTLKELEDFMKKIIEYANIYREKIILIDDSDTFSFDNYIKRLIHIIEELEFSTFYPFILYVMYNHHSDLDKMKELLFKLEKFVIRNMILKIESTKNYSKLCKQFIQRNSSLDSKLSELSKPDIDPGLCSLSNKEAKLLLFWIELYRRSKDERYDESELKYEYQLEHIMPIKWEEHWDFNNVPHPDEKLNYEERRKDRERKIQCLGNMTLLKAKLNNSIKNSDFNRKIKGDNRNKGIKHYASLSITKDDIVEPFERGEITIWNEKSIEERTKKLKEYIMKIWY